MSGVCLNGQTRERVGGSVRSAGTSSTVIECHLKGHSPAETPLVYSCIFLYILVY